MYFSIPEFIMIHLSTVILFHRWIIHPLLHLPSSKLSDYIVFDRHQIQELHWFDKFNCLFCAYANGVTTLWNDELDLINDHGFESINKRILPFAAIYAIVLTLFMIVSFVFSRVLFFGISLFLGYHCMTLHEVKVQLRNERYGSNLPSLFAAILRVTKMYALNLRSNLEQIESAWCPLKHLEGEGRHFPEHHSRFLERNEIEKMVETLSVRGSVSDRKPKY